VLVLPDEAASQLVGEKIRLALKLKDGGYPELVPCITMNQKFVFAHDNRRKPQDFTQMVIVGQGQNMKAYYPYDAGVAIDAPLEKSSMDSIVSFTEEHCEVEDSVKDRCFRNGQGPTIECELRLLLQALPDSVHIVPCIFKHYFYHPILLGSCI